MANKIDLPVLNNDKSLTTKEKLLYAGIQLFSERGYESTTTRMIAEKAGTNIASISFHFGNKENYYYAVLTYVADKIRQDYTPFFKQVMLLHKEHTPSPEEAWKLIEQYVDFLLSIITEATGEPGSTNTAIMNLLFQEQMMSSTDYPPITSVLCTESESVLNLLLRDYWQVQDEEKAAIVSRTITGAIISFGEHPTFIRRELEKGIYSKLDDTVWNTLREFIFDSIKNYRPEK